MCGSTWQNTDGDVEMAQFYPTKSFVSVVFVDFYLFKTVAMQPQTLMARSAAYNGQKYKKYNSVI